MTVALHHGDCREVLATLPAESVQCCVTSPPYFGLRDYGVDGQIGLEPSPQEYVDQLVAVFREVRRVLRKDGTAWLNLGDSYAGGGGFSAGALSSATSKSGKYGGLGALKSGGVKPTGSVKPKDLLLIPARVALALQADGWWVRSEIIWSKAAPMPESVRDRPTCAHEKVWLLTKSERYFYDADAVREPCSELSRTIHGTGYDGDTNKHKYCDQFGNGTGLKGNGKSRDLEAGRNLRNVWHLGPLPYPGAHFATMPPTLAALCIKAGSRLGDTVLDPFAGAGTALLVADRLQRHAIGIELNPEYTALMRKRLTGDSPLFAEVA